MAIVSSDGEVVDLSREGSRIFTEQSLLHRNECGKQCFDREIWQDLRSPAPGFFGRKYIKRQSLGHGALGLDLLTCRVGQNNWLIVASDAPFAESEAENHLPQVWEHVAACIAHDLRAPLGAILFNVATLESRREEMNEDAISAAIAEIRLSCDLQAHIISSLMTSLPRSSDFSVNLYDVLNSLVDEMRDRYEDRAVVLTLEHIDKGDRVIGPALMLRYLFLNLVTNAVEASTAQVRISLRMNRNRADGSCTVLVSDDGGGVLPEHRRRIFDEAFSTKGDARGRGLTLVREIARSFNGGDVRLLPDSSRTCFEVKFGAGFILGSDLEENS